VFFEESDSVLDGDGGSRDGASLRGRLGDGHRRTAQPEAFHEADDGVPVECHHRRATLAFHNWMAEKKNIRDGSGLFKLRGLVAQDDAGR